MSLVKTRMSRLVAWSRKFHAGEEGMESIQVVMILAISAMVLFGVNSIAGVSGGAAGGSSSGSGLLGGVGKMIGSLVPGVVSNVFSGFGL